jgi:hypothetical protein
MVCFLDLHVKDVETKKAWLIMKIMTIR